MGSATLVAGPLSYCGAVVTSSCVGEGMPSMHLYPKVAGVLSIGLACVIGFIAPSYGEGSGARPGTLDSQVGTSPTPTPKPTSAPTPPTIATPAVSRAAEPEDCIAINWRDVGVQGKASVVAGADKQIEIINFDGDRNAAERAVEIIRHYRFDQQCFIGRPDPSMMYWKRRSGVPAGGYPGETCFGVNPDTARAKLVAGEWRLVDGNHWLLTFGTNEREARAAAEIVQRYRINRQCSVGHGAGVRDDRVMTYWLSEYARR